MHRDRPPPVGRMGCRRALLAAAAVAGAGRSRAEAARRDSRGAEAKPWQGEEVFFFFLCLLPSSFAEVTFSKGFLLCLRAQNFV